MGNGVFDAPPPRNEPVFSYGPGAPDREALRAELRRMAGRTIEITPRIGGQRIVTGKMASAVMPHDHARVLAGAIFARERAAIARLARALTPAAGNVYVNDKPTGAVVGPQPFGGRRASGTNDKAGGPLDLWRWVGPRAIKETFVPPTHFADPCTQPDA